MSNPPSRGSGQGIKTYGKHEVPSVNVETEEKENVGRSEEEPPKVLPILRQSTIGRSFPNTGSLGSSPVSTPGTQRRPLPPSGIKLPVPPPSLLSGLPNVQKSASSASLNLHAAAVSPSAAKSDQLRETVTVPNAGQMLAAARAELLNAPRAGTLTRLPPLQMPKMPGPIGERETELKKETEAEANGGERKEEGGRIASLAKGPMPQLKPLEPVKIPPMNLSQSPIPPPPEPTSTSASPVPPPTATPSPLPPARVPPLHAVPNEVPIHHHPHEHNTRRRPSSAGHLPAGRELPALTPHKPLPAISEPNGIKKNGGRFGSSKKALQSRARPWRLAIKCGIVSLFLSIPVVIFVLMMLFSDGFSSSNNNTNGTSSTTTAFSTATTKSMALTTATPASAINIVGGAIFAPISMQNETVAG